MTSLLYYQYLSNLTEDEKIEIDKEVKNKLLGKGITFKFKA